MTARKVDGDQKTIGLPTGRVLLSCMPLVNAKSDRRRSFPTLVGALGSFPTLVGVLGCNAPFGCFHWQTSGRFQGRETRRPPRTQLQGERGGKELCFCGQNNVAVSAKAAEIRNILENFYGRSFPRSATFSTVSVHSLHLKLKKLKTCVFFSEQQNSASRSLLKQPPQRFVCTILLGT